MAQQTIVMHFDSRSDAQKAIDALTQAGVGRSSIRMLPEAETTGYKRTSTTSSDFVSGKTMAASGRSST